ncbi:hypothetical protein K438DRAFT_1766237 [Mycena galopus ATCC 62051]|nr:hypothetical protein K438DRAFT_1766237 [Mycena galopus ATCC 62051]
MSKSGTTTDNPATGNRNRSATVSPTVIIRIGAVSEGLYPLGSAKIGMTLACLYFPDCVVLATQVPYCIKQVTTISVGVGLDGSPSLNKWDSTLLRSATDGEYVGSATDVLMRNQPLLIANNLDKIHSGKPNRK